MRTRLIPSNTFKLALTSVGLGLTLAGLTQYVLMGYTAYNCVNTVVGLGMILLSFTIPGYRFTRTVEVACSCDTANKDVDPYCLYHGL